MDRVAPAAECEAQMGQKLLPHHSHEYICFSSMYCYMYSVNHFVPFAEKLNWSDLQINCSFVFFPFCFVLVTHVDSSITQFINSSQKTQWLAYDSNCVWCTYGLVLDSYINEDDCCLYLQHFLHWHRPTTPHNASNCF